MNPVFVVQKVSTDLACDILQAAGASEANPLKEVAELLCKEKVVTADHTPITVSVDRHPIAVGGVVKTKSHEKCVGEFWFTVVDEARLKKNKLGFVKSLARSLPAMAASEGIDIFACLCDVKSRKNQKLVELLGFVPSRTITVIYTTGEQREFCVYEKPNQ